jgi:hypothetical protein
MTSVSSSFILACLVCIIASSASTHSNLRGGLNIFDLVDLDLDLENLPCYMRNDPRSNDECAKQKRTCEEGKHCFAISVAGRAIYRCYEPCSNTTNTSNTTTTTTSTTATAPVCIEKGYSGCNPNPFIPPNCCAGSYCAGVITLVS